MLEIRRTLVVNAGGPFSRMAGPGGYSNPSPFEIDADCDCRKDSLVPPTGDFHPGWTFDGGAPGEPGAKNPDQLTPVPFCFHDPEGDSQLCFEPYQPAPTGFEPR